MPGNLAHNDNQTIKETSPKKKYPGHIAKSKDFNNQTNATNQHTRNSK